MGGKSSREGKGEKEEELPIPIRQAKKISPRICQITEQIINFCQKDQYNLIENQLKKIKYNLPETSLSLCLDKRNQCIHVFYSVYEWQGEHRQIICTECFKNENEKGYKQGYQLIQKEKGGFCGCGNEEMPIPFQCPKHNIRQKLMQAEEEVNLFKKQIKFLFNLAIFIRESSKNQEKITQNNLEALGKALLDFVVSLALKNNTIAKLIQQILIDCPERLDADNSIKNQKSIFEEMVDYTSSQSLVSNLEFLIECMMRTDREKTGLISIMMKYLLSKEEISLRIVQIFRKAGLKPEVFPRSFQTYFTNENNCSLVMPQLDIENLEFVLKKYTDLTKLYFDLLEQIDLGAIKNPILIFQNIFKKSKLEGILNFQQYYLENNEANEEIYKMGLYYTIFLSKIIPKIVTKAEKMILFKELLRECFVYISNRGTQTFNHVFERFFATLAFEIFQFKVPSKEQLEEVLGPLSYEVVRSIVMRFVQFKVIFEKQYKEIIISCDIELSNEKQNIAQMRIVALDQYFFKTFANLLNYEEVQLLYKGYIQQKIGELLSMNQYQNSNVRQYFLKLSQFLQVFVTALTSQMPELILSANLQKQSKDSLIVLSNLLHIMQNKNSTDFKKEAQKFIQNEELIINFIKKEALVENKKIKYKSQELPFVISLTPDCQYLEENMEFEHYQRVVKNPKERNQFYSRFLDEDSLKLFIEIYTKCIQVVSEADFPHKTYQKQIILTVETLCNLYSFNKSDLILKLIDKLSKKITIPPVRLQAEFKTIFQKDMVDEKEQTKSLSQKKKQKLEAIKLKQQKALSNFKVEEDNKINLECIFCKNSREGEPYLLAHFRYNNFYSKKILQMDAPFMEFTTCGHSAHETCLTEMHKGQFRIWYPCILCKSITNILLPFTPTDLKEEKKLQKFLDFLKNFAATYTFFFQNRKELVEFNLGQIDGVYKLLFKTIIYSLTIYPIVNHAYFVQNQFPILKFIFSLLKYTNKRVKNLTFCAQKELKVNNELSTIFHYHRYQLEFLIINNFSNAPLQRKIDEYRDQFSDELTELFDEIYQNLSDEKQGFQCQLKDQSIRDHIKGFIYKPPNDLNQLRNLKKQCKSCQKVEEQSWICLLCEWSSCSKCTDVRKVHAVQQHIGETVFINSYTGKICYIHQELTGDFNSVYVDYLGHEAQNKKNIGVSQYTLNQAYWSKTVNDIVCNRLHKEVMRLKG